MPRRPRSRPLYLPGESPRERAWLLTRLALVALILVGYGLVRLVEWLAG